MPGKQEFTSFRADVTFEVDTDGDVEAQLESCAAAYEQAETAVETALCQQASDISGLNFEGMGVADELREFKAKLKKSWIKLAAEVEEHGNILEAAKAAGLLNVDLGEEEKEPEKEEEEERPRRRARRETEEEEEEEEEKPKKRGRPPKEQPSSGKAKSREAPTRRRSRVNQK